MRPKSLCDIDSIRMAVTPALYRPDDWDESDDQDLAKALVMAELIRFVEEGGASMRRLESGTLELRFPTGEIFRLGERTTMRAA